ncbi:MAG: GDSL-type esterase/lipase family protein [Victivallaceae bacterium]|nr:GDSL-type esterase/lipase family protein [Victivallaceae bacterium]
MKKYIITLLLLMMTATTATAAVELKNGSTVAFLGDSITYLGASQPSGYCNLVVAALKNAGVEATPVFAGISGHKSNDMLARVDADVLAAKPDLVFLSCGVNDVWHGEKGVPLPQYRENIEQIVDKIQASGSKLVIFTSTMIGEDELNDNNRKLEEYNAFLRELAVRKNCGLADMSAVMKPMIADMVKQGAAPGALLTVDGVHMNPVGNMMMAETALGAVGFDAAMLADARKMWLSQPDSCPVRGAADISIADYLKLDAAAKKQNIQVQVLLNNMMSKAISEL